MAVEAEPRIQHRPVRKALIAVAIALPVLATGVGVVDYLTSAPEPVNPPLPPTTEVEPPAPTGVTGIEPTGPTGVTGIEPTESPSPNPDSKEAIRSQEEVSKNIEVFFDDFSRENLNAWAQNNPIGLSAEDSWRIPLWGGHDEGILGIINYKGGLQNVPAVPALSTIGILRTSTGYKITSYVAVNLGTYEKDGIFFLAAGMMPNPAFSPEISGERVEKYVQFFELVGPNTTYEDTNATYDGYPFIQVQKINGAYLDIGNGMYPTLYDLNAQEYIRRVKENTGSAVYVQGETKDIYDLSLMGIKGENAELGRKVLEIQKNEGWIQFQAGLQLPSHAPIGHAGRLLGASPLINLS